MEWGKWERGRRKETKGKKVNWETNKCGKGKR